jgi:hypothetical protein
MVTTVAARQLIIACGALAHELVALIKLNDWQHLDITCLPAELHNTPSKITAAVVDTIKRKQPDYAGIFVAYADCGTGGALDAALAQFDSVERIPGDHCYEFFAGRNHFLKLASDEIGTFYLTDYLARNFQRLIIKGLKIDRHPELQAMYFAHYKKLVYLAQTDNPQLDALARQAAAQLELEYEKVDTGLDPLNQVIVPFLSPMAR